MKHTTPRGPANPMTEAKREKIRSLIHTYKQHEMADIMNVSRSAVCQALKVKETACFNVKQYSRELTTI